MNPYVSIYPSTAPYYREARVTVERRQTACRMRHCYARRIDETGGKRKLVSTPTRSAERQRIIEVEANRIVKPMAASVSNAATQALSLRRHESCSSSRLPIKAFLLGVKGGYSLSEEREWPPLTHPCTVQGNKNQRCRAVNPQTIGSSISLVAYAFSAQSARAPARYS